MQSAPLDSKTKFIKKCFPSFFSGNKYAIRNIDVNELGNIISSSTKEKRENLFVCTSGSINVDQVQNLDKITGLDHLSRTIARNEVPHPKEVMYKKTIQKLKDTIAGKNKRIKRLKANSTRQKTFGQVLLNTMEDQVPPLLTELARPYILTKGKIEDCRRKWNKVVKNFSLVMYYENNYCYEVMQNSLRLPQTVMVRKWSKMFSVEPGFCPKILECVKEEAKSWPEEDKNIMLLMDEVYLAGTLSYDRTKDFILGYEDLGFKRTSNVATLAFLFMIRCIKQELKQPVGYIFTDHEVSPVTLKEVFETAVRKLQEIGLSVKAFICNLSHFTLRLLKELNVNEENTYLEIDGKRVHVLFDPHLLLKNTRNTLTKNDFVWEDKRASWKDIVDLYKTDLVRPYRVVPKLSDGHVTSVLTNQYKSHYAAQVLSNSVAVGIELGIARGDFDPSALGTLECAYNFDRLYDVFISHEGKDLKPYRRPLSAVSSHWQLFDELLPWVKNLEMRPLSGFRGFNKFQSAWIHNMKSIKNLWEDLRSCGFDCLPAGRFTLDPMRKANGKLIVKDGCQTSPPPLHFTTTYRNLCFNNMTITYGFSRSDVVGEMIIVTLNTYLRLFPTATIPPKTLDKAECQLAVSDSEKPSPSMLINAVLNKLKTLHPPCETCKRFYVDDEIHPEFLDLFQRIDEIFFEKPYILHERDVVSKYLNCVREANIKNFCRCFTPFKDLIAICYLKLLLKIHVEKVNRMMMHPE